MPLILFSLLAAASPAPPPQRVVRHQAIASATIIAGFAPRGMVQQDRHKHRQVARDADGNVVLE